MEEVKNTQAGKTSDELRDEEIFALAKQHFGGSGHELIWQDDPRYAAACDMPEDARWSVSAVRAEQTLAFARELLAASSARSEEMEALRAALQGLVDEFVKVFPVYYYAEPWAHAKNAALLAARASLTPKEKP